MVKLGVRTRQPLLLPLELLAHLEAAGTEELEQVGDALVRLVPTLESGLLIFQIDLLQFF